MVRARLQQLGIVVMLLSLSGCFFAGYDDDDYDYDYDYDFDRPPRLSLTVAGGHAEYALGDVRVDASTKFRVRQEHFGNVGFNAVIDLRAETPDGAAMFLLKFTEGIQADWFTPGNTLEYRHRDPTTDQYESIHFWACTGPREGSWTLDNVGPGTIQVEPSDLEGYVRLVFKGELPPFGDVDGERITVTGEVDVMLEEN